MDRIFLAIISIGLVVLVVALARGPLPRLSPEYAVAASEQIHSR
jgi:hypothetical protein